jgi:hypothetical protein
MLADVKTFRFEFEFSVDIDDPLQQKCSLSVFDFSLDFLKVIWWVYFVLFLLDQ